MMLTIKKLFTFLAIILITQSCVKKEIELANLEGETFDPSFASSLGGATFNMGRLERNYVDDKFEYNPITGLLEYVYSKRLFTLGLSDMFQIPNMNATASFGMPGANQSSMNGGGAGTVVNFSSQSTTTFPVSSSELIDSIIVRNGTMDINLSSDFTHDGSIDITIPSLKLNGVAFTTTLNLNYIATVPVTASLTNFDLSGYTIDLTDGGITDNTARYSFNAQITSSGAPVLGTESLSFTIDFTVDTIQQANGYFGSYTNILAKDTAFIDFFENINGQVHIEDPRIELSIFNTAGISVATFFTGVSAPDNSTQTTLGGPALTSIPIIVGATSITDTGVTNFIIDNANTSPTLTQVIDEGPGEIIYDASSTTNQGLPNTTQNFVTYNSKVWCDSRLALPLYGWGNDFTFIDTTDADIEDMIDVDSADAENIDKVTLRIIVDNGLPIETRIQVYFADTNNVVIDSLFSTATGEDIIRQANVNFSVPISDINYGTVTSSVRKITDIIIDKTRFNNLANSGAKKIIYKAKGLTNQAPIGNNVKFSLSNSISIKLSAKVDFNINVNQ
jgi:hypothetical protein